MQTISYPWNEVQSAFKKNSSTQIAAYFQDNVVLDIQGSEGVYSKNQGSAILQNFMKNHACSGFEIIFKGKETSSGSFGVGNYSSGKDKYRVTINFKVASNVAKIESLSIE